MLSNVTSHCKKKKIAKCVLLQSNWPRPNLVPVSVRCGLRTTDYGLAVKCRLGVKYRLQTKGKTQAGGKM